MSTDAKRSKVRRLPVPADPAANIVHRFDDGSWLDNRPDGLTLWREVRDKNGEAGEVGGEIIAKPTRLTFAPLHVAAATLPADEKGAHGWVIEYQTPHGLERRAFGADVLLAERAPLFKFLLARGVRLNMTSTALTALRCYLGAVRPVAQVTAYPRTGWQTTRDGRAVFVLGEGAEDIIGDATGILQPEATVEVSTGRAGTHAEWLAHVARPACALAWWRLCLSAAFAAPLMHVIDTEGFTLAAVGGTSKGKSLGTFAAASVYGRGSKPASDGYVRSWNATGNAIEGLAEAHSDLLLVLDDMSEADPRAVAAVVYSLAGGRGRSRMNSDTTMRRQKRWRTLALSTSEVSVESKIAQAGGKSLGGMAARVLEVPIDQLSHTLEGEAVRRLEGACSMYYGTAGPAFIARLVAEYAEATSAAVIALKARIDAIEAELAGDGDQRQRRVARRFAIIAAAGELAVKWELLPAEADPIGTVGYAFAVWRAGAGTHDIDDARKIAGRLVDYIDQHQGAAIEPLEANPDRRPPVKRAGWWRDDSVYLLRPALEEVLGGTPRMAFLRAALAAGALVKGEDRNWPAKVPGQSGRAFHFRTEALRAWADGAPVVAFTIDAESAE